MPSAAGRAPAREESTRDRVLRHVLEHGPVTAAVIADHVDLTPTAVRRHLEHLTGSGAIRPTPGTAMANTARGRGRPARAYVVTPQGHRRLGGDVDLATSSLRFLAERLGEAAVHDFARQRLADREARYREAVEAAGPDVEARARALAGVLADDGFAASARPVGMDTPRAGVQLCQGHCPIHEVVGEFPQFCEAEADAFARLLGVHVQRLATLANGEHVCTTFVPLTGSGEPARSTAVPLRRSQRLQGSHPGTVPATIRTTQARSKERTPR